MKKQKIPEAIPITGLSNLIPKVLLNGKKSIGGPGADGVNDCIALPNSDCLIASVSNSNISFEKTEDSRGYSDYWIVKLDFAGNIEWQKTLGGNRAESFGDLIETADGGYIVTGSSESGISGNKTEPSKGSFDWWIVKA